MHLNNNFIRVFIRIHISKYISRTSCYQYIYIYIYIYMCVCIRENIIQVNYNVTKKNINYFMMHGSIYVNWLGIIIIQ